ncbi:MAG: hypothetical protein K1X54_07565 [Flavobacteriales bacterium]|nr:hypothetical protein [Flavobacteriales bacterium]
MSITDLAKDKVILIDWILKQEKAQNLKSLLQLTESIDNETANLSRNAGYRGKGIPVSMSQLRTNFAEAISQIERGEFKSLEDVEQESDKW